MASRTLGERLSLLAGTWFGTGYAPVASGTVGTAAAVPLYLLLVFLAGEEWMTAAVAVAAAAAAVGGALAAGRVERLLEVHDPSEVVIDEVAGFLVAMIMVPPGVITIVCGFLLFRLFDILKPWPAGPMERIGGGWGIMADDLVCGLYANLVLQAGLWALA